MMLGFESTYMMNFATWESLYSLYPFSTLYSDAMGKLTTRTCAETLLYEGEIGNNRHVGDQWTYRIGFTETSQSGVNIYSRYRFGISNGVMHCVDTQLENEVYIDATAS